MSSKKTTLAASTCLVVGAVATGGGSIGQAHARQARKPDLPQIAAQSDDASQKQGPGRMFVMGRVLDPNGKPVPNASVMVTPRAPISMVVTPGEFSAIKARNDGTLVADEDFLSDIDPINYQKDPVSAADGRITFPALVPGATYRVVDRTAGRTPSGPQLRKEFTVKPGETLDLGEILIERPPT